MTLVHEETWEGRPAWVVGAVVVAGTNRLIVEAATRAVHRALVAAPQFQHVFELPSVRGSNAGSACAFRRLANDQ